MKKRLFTTYRWAKDLRGAPAPGRTGIACRQILGYVSIDKTPHYIAVGHEEMTEGSAVFDTHMPVGMAETAIPVPSGKSCFGNAALL
jgi:hypothetical protein